MSMVASQHHFDLPARIVVMGVAGCGKTTIGEMIAKRTGAQFRDGDALHPQANIAKISAGTPLTDDDRWPWLEQVGKALATARGTMIIGCSALKRDYRDCIREAAGGDVTFIHLSGSRELIAGRMAGRKGHFMPLALLDSQFATLEPLQADETAIVIDIARSEAAIVGDAVAALEGMKP